ncbi:MAG: hypothetical protein ABSF69_19035 [Polyangiaceae bacterium]
MIGQWALLAPLSAQATAMAFDEFHFHRQRGLGSWERIGHPFDTLTMLACIAWALFTRPDVRGVACYVAFALASSLAITKDEWVHARHCSPAEHWLHSVLFLLHPIALGSVGVLWVARHAAVGDLPDWWARAAPVARWLPVAFALTGAFWIYQVTYWMVRWPRFPPTR